MEFVVGVKRAAPGAKNIKAVLLVSWGAGVRTKRQKKKGKKKCLREKKRKEKKGKESKGTICVLFHFLGGAEREGFSLTDSFD